MGTWTPQAGRPRRHARSAMCEHAPVNDDLEHQLQLSASLVTQRVEMGDRAEVPREVDHVAFFKSKDQAAQAARELEQAGFTITDTRRRLLRIVVEFKRVDAVDHATAATFTRQVVPIIESHGGSYDGWGAMLQD